MRLSKKYVLLIGAMSGMVAPALWLYEVNHGWHIGDPGSPLNYLPSFFPTSILFFAAPTATGWLKIGITVVAVLLNILLYAIAAYLACILVIPPSIFGRGNDHMSWPQVLFSLRGRIRRRTYWVGFAILLGAFIVINALLPIDFFTYDLPLDEARARPYAMLKPAAYVQFALVNWVVIALGVKRCHDRNHAGWYMLIYLIPMVGELWLWGYLGFFTGTPGPNRFGPDPLLGASSEPSVLAQ